MPDRHDDAADAGELNRLWNDLVRGGDAPVPEGFDLPAADVRLLRAFHARGTGPLPSAARERAWRKVLVRIDADRSQKEVAMHATIASPTGLARPAPNGRADPRADRGVPPRRPPTLLAHLATAALLLVTVAGIFVTLGGGRLPAFVPGSQEEPPSGGPANAGFYRGDAARTGINPGPGPSGVPEERWIFRTGPGMYSAPVVAEGLIFGTDESGVLYAVDAATGTERWRLDTGAVAVRAAGPAVDDGTVYVGMPDGVFYALDAATGERRWTYESGLPSCAAPAVAAGVVYGAAGCDPPGGVVFALDAATGSEKWRVATSAGRVPTPAVDGDTVYVAAGGGVRQGSSSSALLALDAATGSERWRFDTKGGIWSAPAVADGVVYVGSSTGTFALDAESGAQRWHHPVSTWSSPSVADGLVLAPSDRTMLYALDAETGEERWRFQSMTTPQFESETTVVDGVVYLGNQNGAIFALDAATGSERWRVQLRAGVHVPPTVVGGVVYLGVIQDGAGAIVALADPAPAG